MSGVDQVVDGIEELPVSPNDDELRWKTYYAIYRDPFLSRYAPGGGLLWGHRHPFGDGFYVMGPTRFPGMEPIGDYPIHIIVKSGKITLLGVVDTEGDKTTLNNSLRNIRYQQVLLRATGTKEPASPTTSPQSASRGFYQPAAEIVQCGEPNSLRKFQVA